MWVENRLDEVRVGAKDQSNSEIARIPRNSFRASLMELCNGGRDTEWVLGSTRLPNPIKLRIPLYVP